MEPYTLAPVEKAIGDYKISGKGNYLVKVRAIVRDPETNVVVNKRGVAFETDNINDIPAFVLNVYKNWDGRGELQYCVIEHLIDPAKDLYFRLDQWTPIS